MSNAQCIATLHVLFGKCTCPRERETIAWSIAKLTRDNNRST